MDADVRLLLLNQPGRDQRQGRMEASSNSGVQEFTSEGRCKAAKSSLEGSLKEAGAKLKSGLEDLKSIGKG